MSVKHFRATLLVCTTRLRFELVATLLVSRPVTLENAQRSTHLPSLAAASGRREAQYKCLCQV